MSVVAGAEAFHWTQSYCLICGSLNHIFVDKLDAMAWECWNCTNKWWIEDSNLEEYMTLHGKTEKEAELELMDGTPPMSVLNGQSSR